MQSPTGWPPIAPPQSQGQPYYRINATALTWGELAHFIGNPLLLLILFVFHTFPLLTVGHFVAFCKLLRIPLLSDELFPREIGLEASSFGPLAERQEVHRLLRSFRPLGFERFGAFRVVGFAYDNVLFPLMHAEENAYATVYQMTSAMGTTVWCDFATQFADGSSLTTTHKPEVSYVASPPERRRQVLADASPATLWSAHRALASQIAPSAGGIGGPVSVAHYEQFFCQDYRTYADLMIGRGVWVPAEVP